MAKKSDLLKAAHFARNSFERAMAALGPANAAVHSALDTTARLFSAAGDLQRTEEFLKLRVELAEQHLEPERPAISAAYSALMTFYTKIRRYDDSLKANVKMLEWMERACEQHHPHYVEGLRLLANNFRILDRNDEAAAVEREADERDNYQKFLTHLSGRADAVTSMDPRFAPGGPLHDKLKKWYSENRETLEPRAFKDPKFNPFDLGRKVILAQVGQQRTQADAAAGALKEE